MNVLGIHGRKRVGKNALGDIIEQEYGFAQLAFADTLRMMLQPLNIEPIYLEEKNIVIPGYGKTFTELLQTLGTDWGRNMIGDHMWIEAAERRRKLHENIGYHNFVFTDIRYVNEAEYVKGLGGKIIHLTGPRGIVVNNHSSEIPLPDRYFDYHIENDGTLEDLKGKVFTLMEELGV